MPGPLDGLLVADFSRVLAGPLAAMTLGDLGADVVKVERPGSGDDTRTWGDTYFLGLNRNKRSVALDLADAADLALARRLALRADVVVESFRPGLMERFGLDHATLAAQHPGLITCSISAFGRSEAAAGLPGYDLLLQAVGGLMSVTGQAEGPPTKVGAAVVDLVCGLHAVTGVLAALRARDATGAGQHVEVSLMDSALGALLNQASSHLNGGALPQRMGNRHPSIAPYETFACADGDLALAVGNDALFARLCAVLGLDGLQADPRFATNPARLEHRDALAARIGAVLATAPVADWVARLGAAGVPAGPIHDVAQAFAFARELGLDPVDETGGVTTVRPAVRLSGTPASVRLPPPALDEHGAALRAWLAQEV
jgi:crotonobetainyl-CoA:carnitine CoA-transferase CaiB-like acyl-CoA transferase